ncbi:putative sulfate exporter family transporter [Lysinibacillus endophyticus]|uniref:YeiH family protein n=1 Tax=Ureibacillus endophyticus TaxID=1978490 RepID=UPI001FEA6E69|nr:putative sulfate exporter family transporter [Lysinibacillus endophyticus]MCP1144359.1 putative sulfate exporter family transporter [Lysinibacillus endophyticus]
MHHEETEEYVRKSETFTKNLLWLAGIFFTFAIAILGFVMAKVPGLAYIGPLAIAIIIAVIYRQLFGYPEMIRSGIQYSSKKLLRYAIILYGLKLNMEVVFHQGMGLLVRDIGTIIFSILLTMWLAKKLKADFSLSLLLGIGTGICGAAAIAAVSPILKAKEEDTAIGAGIIALVGTVFSIGYILLKPFLDLTDIQYGIWSGISLHEIAHVALASAPAGQDALAVALLAKLGRVFLLVPLCFILIIWMKRTGKAQSDMKIEFPWFLIGFLVMSLFGSYVLGEWIIVHESVLNNLSNITTLLLTMAMVGLGLNVNLKELRSKALRPFIAMLITSILLSLITFLTL